MGACSSVIKPIAHKVEEGPAITQSPSNLESAVPNEDQPVNKTKIFETVVSPFVSAVSNGRKEHNDTEQSIAQPTINQEIIGPIEDSKIERASNSKPLNLREKKLIRRGTEKIRRMSKKMGSRQAFSLGFSSRFHSERCTDDTDDIDSSRYKNQMQISPRGISRRTSEFPHISRSGGVRHIQCVKKPQDITLEIISRDDKIRQGFFKYIQATAISQVVQNGNGLNKSNTNNQLDCSSSAVTRKRNGRLILNDFREDCVYFWLEMSDLIKIPSSGVFQFNLMIDLYETYIEKGAARQLRIVTDSERNRMAQRLAEKDTESVLFCLKSVLLGVLNIVTPCFDAYICDMSNLGYAATTRQNVMMNTLARAAAENIGGAIKDRRGLLYDVVKTPPVCRLFQEFLSERNSLEIFLFVIDGLAFEDLVNTVGLQSTNGTQTKQDESNQNFCLRQAQKVFNKYIRYGAKSEICLGSAVKDRMLRELMVFPLEAKIFTEAVLSCCSELVQSQLDPFYSSPAYHQYIASRQLIVRRPVPNTTVHKLKSHTKSSATSAPRIEGSAISDESQDNTPYLNSSNYSGQMNGEALLREILEGPGALYFQRYLKEIDEENYWLFYNEVEQFKLVPHVQKHYIQTKAKKIFDVYIRRGGKLEIAIPFDVRRTILWKLSTPTELSFQPAQMHVFGIWQHKHLENFLHHDYYDAMIQAIAKSNEKEGNEKAESLSRSTLLQKGSKMSSIQMVQNVVSKVVNGEMLDTSTLTLKDFLELEFLRHYFRLYLEKEQLVMDLLFYIEIINFQQLPSSDFQKRQAQKLINRFCDSNSRERATISPEVEKHLQESLKHPSPAMFNKAHDELLELFEHSLFPKFIKSDVYQLVKMSNAEFKMKAGAARDGDETKEQTDVVPVGHPPPLTKATSNARSLLTSALSLSSNQLSEKMVSVAMILELPETRMFFITFAEEIFCTESIYFWIDCNEYKDIPHQNYLKLRAQKIYRKYISPDAKLQVNIDSKIVKQILIQMNNPTRTLFAEAQKSITKMLERDTLEKFKKSSHFRACFTLLQEVYGKDGKFTRT